MNAPVECEGAPRDLGRDQGLACAAMLRQGFAAEPFPLRLGLRLGRASRRASALGRELRRHFPRQAETLAGLATASGVPAAWLAELQLREACPGEAALAAAAGGELVRTGAVLGRALEGQWIVRRSRPEGGFRCLEVTRPWLAHALLGVNEAGLAAAVTCAELGPGRGAARGASGTGAPLPAAALATDCLQRFATLEACLEWCEARPGDGPATLLFADASGEIAGIDLAPGRRRVMRAAEGWLAVGGSRERREALATALREGAGIDPALAWADSAGRALRLGPGDPGLEV